MPILPSQRRAASSFHRPFRTLESIEEGAESFIREILRDEGDKRSAQ